MSDFLNMKSYNFLVSVLILINISSTAQNRTYPPVYGLDFKDGSDIQILKRLMTTDCVIWRSTLSNKSIYLIYYASQWRIRKNIGSISPEGKPCHFEGGNLLFHQAGEEPYSEGWYDMENKRANVSLSLYALEECVTYTGAYVDSGFSQTSTVRDVTSCSSNIFFTNHQSLYLITTRPQNISSRILNHGDELQMPNNKLLCSYNQLQFYKRGTLVLSDNENAMILIKSNSCNNATSIDISEALKHHESYSTSSYENEGEFQLEVVIGAVTCGVVVVFLVLLSLWCSRRFCSKKKSIQPGHYDIDNNPQYGQEEEYYHYHHDKKQTQVVDENEVYEEYGQN